MDKPLKDTIAKYPKLAKYTKLVGLSSSKVNPYSPNCQI